MACAGDFAVPNFGASSFSASARVDRPADLRAPAAIASLAQQCRPLAALERLRFIQKHSAARTPVLRHAREQHTRRKQKQGPRSGDLFLAVVSLRSLQAS